ncbi:MAG: dihydropteroate synthase [Bacteroidales bacterium]|nr:dihydropteroate synthase [Bacteroidales bacterium]
MESFSIVVRGRLVEFHRPLVMGILNVTDDSFYDGGRFRSVEAAVAHARQMAAEGADVIDIGASSSRPGAKLLPPDVEAARLTEAVKAVREALPEAILSVDTCFAAPARAAIEAGADIVNDIGGGDLDEGMFATVAELQVPYVLMCGGREHVEGGSRSQGSDPIERMVQFFSSRLDRLYRLGVKDVWLDPGFGFAQTVDESHAMFAHLGELAALFREPLLVGVSRKRMVYQLLGCTPDGALAGTVALGALALERGAKILRVHDVREAAQTIRLLEAGRPRGSAG